MISAMGTSEFGRYALALTDGEILRYRFMAQSAREREAHWWSLAGITDGARVLDLGCGPGLVAIEMAKVVGTSGSVIGVDRQADAVSTARALLDEAGHPQTEVYRAEAWNTELQPGTFDVVVLRHVLAHNTTEEVNRILEHVRFLLRPGGCCYVAESDLTANRVDPPIADLADLTDRYIAYLRSVGRNPSAGPMMGSTLIAAGFELVGRHAEYVLPPRGRGVRPPSWAAREAMVQAGIATLEDVTRWDRALTDHLDDLVNAFIAGHIIIGKMMDR
jgi:ubiquinone/menaquinone biosynthesis C-methylase UbiE